MPCHAWIFPGLLLAVGAAASAAPTKLYYDPTPIPEEDVLTQRGDNQRTGRAQTSSLSPATDWSRFGYLFDLYVGGDVFAQPLYVSGLDIGALGGGFPIRNVVFVATMWNDVYAFDAWNSDNGGPLWQVHLGPPVPVQQELNDLHADCGDIRPDGFIGVLATPVIDRARGLMYVVAKTFQPGAPKDPYAFTAFQLDLRTGRILRQSGFAGTLSIHEPGIDGFVGFDALHQLNRPGLLLTHENKLLVAFGGHCDQHPYRGWVFQLDASTLGIEEVHASALQNSARGNGIWQAGTGLATAPDVPENSVYYASGNGDADPAAFGVNLTNSLVRLCIDGVGGRPCASPMPPRLVDWRADDWFTPQNRDYLNMHDLDLGSSGPTIVSGGTTLYALIGGKEGSLYLADARNLGRFDSSVEHIFQKFQAVYHSGLKRCGFLPGVEVTCHIHGSPVWWRPDGGDAVDLFVWGESDHLRGYRLHDGARHVDEQAFAVGAEQDCDSCMPGGILSLSSDHQRSGTGMVWATQPLADGNQHDVAGQLLVYDAANLRTLWASGHGFSRLGKFAPPTVAHDRVFVATHEGWVRTFGLRTQRVCEDYKCGLHNGEFCGPCPDGQICKSGSCQPEICQNQCGQLSPTVFCHMCPAGMVCDPDLHICVCPGPPLAARFEGALPRCKSDRIGPSDRPIDRRPQPQPPPRP